MDVYGAGILFRHQQHLGDFHLFFAPLLLDAQGEYAENLSFWREFQSIRHLGGAVPRLWDGAVFVLLEQDFVVFHQRLKDHPRTPPVRSKTPFLSTAWKNRGRMFWGSR